MSDSHLALHDAMRLLWQDHVTWTRLYIIEFGEGTGAVNVTAERLLRNQEDIGNAVKPYYGEGAGDQLTALLKDHILIATEILQAAKEGNTTEVDRQNALWQQNADEIASLLASANPNWSQAELRAMLLSHLDLTLQEGTARLNQDYAAEPELYDSIRAQAMEMADALTEGIVAQFPERFAS